MLITLLALLALAAPGDEWVNEPASEEDRAARVAYFDSLVKLGAIRPCQDRFPKLAKAFAASHSAWSRQYAALIKAGKKSIEDAAGPEAANDAFPLAEAQAAMTTVLSGLPGERRLPWCEEHFPAHADSPAREFEAGVLQLQDDDDSNDARALAKITAAADQGHPNAEASVAMMYLDGAPRFGISPDIARGLKYLESAAGHGLNHAQLALGMHYATGEIVARDAALAEKWLTLGVAQSDADMHAAFADMLEKGEGVTRSLPKALRYYSHAADMGHAWAAQKAASMLLAGDAVPRDPPGAYHYALLAAKLGNKDAEPLRRDASAALVPRQRRVIEERLEDWVPRAPHPSASLPLLPTRPGG